METRLIFAIWSMFFAGMYNFTMKMAAERKYNISYITIYTYLVTFFLSWICLIYNNYEFSYDTILIIIFLSLLNWVSFLLSIFSRVESLKNIDSVIFFPLYKTIWPILATILSILYFNETLSLRDTLWITLGILIPLLLITKTEHKVQKNLLRWIFFILVTALLTTIASWSSKTLMEHNLDIFAFMFISSIFWLVFFYFINKYKKWVESNHTWKWFILFVIISWLLHFLSFYAFTKALEWNLAIVYTINSLSILIPVILSVFFYKEHFNLKKWIILILSIISLILFI